jgi:excisionase family DNA binding protein
MHGEKPMNDNALSIKEVAEYFSVSTRTIRDWMKKDDNFPKPFKKFGTLRFSKAMVDQYWEKNIQEVSE